MTISAMINLLSAQDKKEILSRKKAKLMLIFEIGILLFLISSWLGLFAAESYLGGEIASKKIILAQKAAEMDEKAVFDFRDKAAVLNEKLQTAVVSYKSRIWLSQSLEKIYEALPADGYLTGFSYSRGLVSVNGFVPTREKLLLFKSNLEKNSSFIEIDFPPVNWVSSKDIEFYITFKLK